MYNLIKVCLYIGNFNAGTPKYHHYLLSSNLLSVLKGREECSVISCMHTYWIILIPTLILTLISNVLTYKSKYQSISYHYASYYLLDHYGDYHLFYHYADHHMGTAFKF